MLNRIEVSNFQSLREAVVPLGRFTVVTGPTGSGKSALFRAVRTLALNARGTSYIAAGQKSCTVGAGGGDGACWGRGWVVRLTRSAARGGKNEYQVAQEVPLQTGAGAYGWSGGKFTKLGGQVPPQVTELLQLSDLNFARQLDPPYLLGLPGSEIARKLGDLTNVSLVLGAAGEANRIRKQLSRDLEAARARREALLAEITQFAGLRERRSAAEAAEKALQRAQGTSARCERLRALTGRLEAAEKAEQAARAEAARQAPPSLDKLEELAARRARLLELAGALASAERSVSRCEDEAEQAAADEQAAQQAVHDALAAAGQCPTCGQAVA